MSACHSRIRFGDLLPRLEVGHQLAVVDVEDVGLDAELRVAGLDFGLAALRQRSARLREVADVAVGERHELDLVPLRGKERRRTGELQLGVIGMRAECDDPERPVRGNLSGKPRHEKKRKQDREHGSATHAAPRAIAYIVFFPDFNGGRW